MYMGGAEMNTGSALVLPEVRCFKNDFQMYVYVDI